MTSVSTSLFPSRNHFLVRREIAYSRTSHGFMVLPISMAPETSFLISRSARCMGSVVMRRHSGGKRGDHVRSHLQTARSAQGSITIIVIPSLQSSLNLLVHRSPPTRYSPHLPPTHKQTTLVLFIHSSYGVITADWPFSDGRHISILWPWVHVIWI